MPNHQSIISNAMNKPADQYKAPTVKPITTQVNAGNETVASQLNNLTEKGSRYTNLAATDAKREANSRGLINSSMAAAAGTEAAIKAALPIAQQDAKTYTDTRFNNQNVENKFLENRQGANLTQEVNAQGSQLKKAENAQNADLNIKVATAQSGLTNEENTLLNQLTMKRDQGLSTLTQAENAQLNDLTMKRDSAQNQQAMGRASQANQLAINRDNNSAALNESLATLESGLKKSEMKLDAGLQLTLEEAIQSQKFSDNAKMNILASINQIIADSQAQVVQVGLSDRTGAQQAAAIIDIQTNRDAALAVYQDMLKSMPGWKWDTNFTPTGGTGGGVGGAAGGKPSNPAIKPAGTNYPTYPTDPTQAQDLEASVFRGDYKDQNTPPSGGVRSGSFQGAGWRMSNDGRWRWDFSKSQWIPGTFNL